ETRPRRCNACGRSGSSASRRLSTISASSRRPAASYSPARVSCRASASAGFGGGVMEAAGSGPGPGPMAVSVHAVPPAFDHRRENVDRGLQVLPVVPIAIARAIVEGLGHLGIAGCARIAPVPVETDAGRVKRLADEVEHPAYALHLLVDDVLVADRQVAPRPRPAIMVRP